MLGMIQLIIEGIISTKYRKCNRKQKINGICAWTLWFSSIFSNFLNLAFMHGRIPFKICVAPKIGLHIIPIIPKHSTIIIISTLLI